MCRITASKVSLFVALILVSMQGCSTSRPPSEVPIPASYTAARNGILYYRLPEGWFDATANARSSRVALWLMRNDYSGSIVINEVTLDAAARQETGSDGLLRLAQLTMSLSSTNVGATMLHLPETIDVNGKNVCAYEMLTSSKDTVRVLLVDTGTHVFEIRALAEGRLGGASVEEIFSAQQGLLNGLRW